MPELVDLVGRKCRLKAQTRATDGTIHDSKEQLTIKRVVMNLEREMFLISFFNETTAYVFPNEVEILDN